jgi:DNA-binding MarR family transcriptional regulator
LAIAREKDDPQVTILNNTVCRLVRRDKPDLSARQLAIFLTCYLDLQTQTVRGLSDYLYLSRPAITRALDRLAQFELVRRKPDPLDRRSVVIQRTAAGNAFMRELRSIMSAASVVTLAHKPILARQRIRLATAV